MDKNDDYNFESLAGTADFDEVIWNLIHCSSLTLRHCKFS